MKQISKNGFFQDIYNNWPYFLLLVLILLSPRFTLFQLTATRNFDLRIEDLFIAGLAILAFFQLLKKRISVIPKIPGLWMIGVYVTVALVSTLAGTFNHTLDPLKSWFYYLKEIEYFILFLFIAAWKDARSHVSTIIGIIAGAVIINAIYSWIMFIVFHAAGPDNGRYTILGLVEISKFPLGAFYYIISIMVLGELFFGDKTSKVLKALFITAFVFSTFSCLFIISRASIVMMMVSFSILMMYYLKFESKKALFIIPLIAVFFAIIFVVMLVFFKDKIPIFAYMKSSSSITARISEVWAPVLQCLFHGDFLFGLGKGFSGLRNFDSLYVKVMVETGFVGTFFFFAFLTFFMINLLKKRVDSPDLKKVRITYIAIFGGMLVGGIFSETMFIVKVGELFWFFSGLTFATFNGLPRNDPSNSSGPGIFKRVAKWVYYSVYVKILPEYFVELMKATAGCKTLLDVGCGSDSPVQILNKQISCTGVDAFKNSLDISKGKKIHKNYFQMNVLDIGKKFKKESYDCVVALDLIEHLTKKDGAELIKQMEKLAKKRIILFTPNGFLKQGSIKENPYQVHISGWSAEEMKKLGFTVIGINGWKPLRKELAHIRFRPWFFWRIISDISQLFVRNNPEKAFQILCIKDK